MGHNFYEQWSIVTFFTKKYSTVHKQVWTNTKHIYEWSEATDISFFANHSAYA